MKDLKKMLRKLWVSVLGMIISTLSTIMAFFFWRIVGNRTMRNKIRTK